MTCRVLLLLGVALAAAWDQQPDGYEVIDGPGPTQDVDEWRRQWTAWRQMELRTVRYDASASCNVYNLEPARWTQRSFVQAFLMLHDRDIFDRQQNAYTVDKYVAAMERRVGKLDSVLLWPAYPNSGIDNRNQWDFLRSLPGGIDGLRKLIRDFHDHGIRVVLPYNPWDTATRDEPGLEDVVRMYGADIQTIQSLLPEVGADAFNGDTMYGVPKAFFNCAAPIVATPEGGVPSAFLSHNPISWGYYYGYSNFPPVARPKFLESRHMVQVCARWSLDRLTDIQAAFFNGVGYVVWENVWGIWNAMTARESEAVKRVFDVLRTFSEFTSSPNWRPYAIRSNKDQVFGTMFPHPVQNGSAIYTVINAAHESQTYRLLVSTPSAKVFDVFNGVELHIDEDSTVGVALEGRGFGAVLVSLQDPRTLVSEFTTYLASRRKITSTPLADFSSTRELLTQEITRAPDPSLSVSDLMANKNGDVDVLGMVYVKGAKGWWFNVTGVQIEPAPAWTPNWHDYGTGVQFPWEQRPWNNHSVRLDIQDFYIEQHPVTNEQFRKFLLSASYSPRDLDRFLEHWTNRWNAQSNSWNPVHQWNIPIGLEQSPVVFVSIEDARAYASFYKKRLPHDWEWQYVAMNGEEYSLYPWGNDFDQQRLPPVSRDKYPRLPDVVGSFPRSQAKATDVQDLVGLVWQMTDEFCDVHTCGTLLRGGSFYRPVGSTLGDPNWYFPQAYRSNQHNRLLTLSNQYDRSAFMGFRCVRTQ